MCGAEYVVGIYFLSKGKRQIENLMSFSFVLGNGLCSSLSLMIPKTENFSNTGREFRSWVARTWVCIHMINNYHK